MPRLLPFLPLPRRAALAAPAAASAPRPGDDLRGARRADVGRRPRGDARAIQSMGVTRVRALVYWRDFTAEPRSKAPASTPRPGRVSRGHVGASWTGWSPATARAAWSSSSRSRAPARSGRRRRATTTRRAPSTTGAGSGGPRAPAERRPLVDLERAEPPGLPRPAVQERLPGLAGRLPRPLRRGREGHPRRPGQRDMVLFGETAPVGNSNLVAPMVFLAARSASTSTTSARGLPEAADGGLRPPCLRPRGRFVRRTPRGLDRLARPAGEGLDKAAKGGRDQEEAAAST